MKQRGLEKRQLCLLKSRAEKLQLAFNVSVSPPLYVQSVLHHADDK